MGLVPHHPAEFVLMREDYGKIDALSMQDQLSSPTGQLYMIRIRQIKCLKQSFPGMQSALYRIDAIQIIEVLWLGGREDPSWPSFGDVYHIINRHNYNNSWNGMMGIEWYGMINLSIA